MLLHIHNLSVYSRVEQVSENLYKPPVIAVVMTSQQG